MTTEDIMRLGVCAHGRYAEDGHETCARPVAHPVAHPHPVADDLDLSERQVIALERIADTFDRFVEWMGCSKPWEPK